MAIRDDDKVDAKFRALLARAQPYDTWEISIHCVSRRHSPVVFSGVDAVDEVKAYQDAQEAINARGRSRAVLIDTLAANGIAGYPKGVALPGADGVMVKHDPQDGVAACRVATREIEEIVTLCNVGAVKMLDTARNAALVKKLTPVEYVFSLNPDHSYAPSALTAMSKANYELYAEQLRYRAGKIARTFNLTGGLDLVEITEMGTLVMKTRDLKVMENVEKMTPIQYRFLRIDCADQRPLSPGSP